MTRRLSLTRFSLLSLEAWLSLLSSDAVVSLSAGLPLDGQTVQTVQARCAVQTRLTGVAARSLVTLGAGDAGQARLTELAALSRPAGNARQTGQTVVALVALRPDQQRSGHEGVATLLSGLTRQARLARLTLHNDSRWS